MRRSCVSWQIPALIAILLLGLALRLAPWGDNRFLEDEALYAYWGLQIATGADPMLNLEPVDKPPLYPYTLALSFLLFGPPSPTEAPPVQTGGQVGGRAYETAARLPGLLASLAGMALLYALGCTLYADARIGLLAALLLALSPFDLLFASTAFTDPLMVCLVLGALVAAASGRLGVAGLLSGLAAATKQQGLLFLPLVVAIGLLSPGLDSRGSPGFRPGPGSGDPGRAAVERAARKSAGRWARRAWAQGWVRFVVGLALVVAGVLWWDAARLQRPGFLEQSLISYGGLGPAQPQALGQHAEEWLRLVGLFWASPWFNGLLVVVLLVWLAGGLAGWWPRWSKVDLALALFVGGFLLLHWLVGFQVWDRYLLGLVPLVALLAARALVSLCDAIRSTPGRWAYAAGMGALLACTLAGPILHAVQSELPAGGDHGAYDGIEKVAATIRRQAPPGSVLYHDWLGYHYRFYLYGAPLRLHWYPDPQDLAHDATVYRREPRYIAFPSWRDSSPARAALAAAGIRLQPLLETTRRDGSVSFRLYRLDGP